MEKFVVVTPIMVLNLRDKPYMQDEYRVCTISRNLGDNLEKGETSDSLIHVGDVVYNAVSYELCDNGFRTEWEDDKGNKFVAFDNSETNFIKVGTKGLEYARAQANVLHDMHYEAKNIQYRINEFQKLLTFSPEED